MYVSVDVCNIIYSSIFIHIFYKYEIYKYKTTYNIK